MQRKYSNAEPRKKGMTMVFPGVEAFGLFCFLCRDSLGTFAGRAFLALKKNTDKSHTTSGKPAKEPNFPTRTFCSIFTPMRFLSVIFIFPFLIAALELDIGSIEQTFHDEYDHYVINKMQTSDSSSLDQNAKSLKFPFGILAAICPNLSFNPSDFFRINNTFGEIHHSASKLFILFHSLLI